jgi:hypothetical protein
MQVKHGLARISAAVDNRAERFQPLLTGHLGSHKHQVAQQGLVPCSGISKLGDRLTWNHQHMDWSLGRYVAESQALLICIHLIAGDLAAEDAPKDRVLAHRGNKGGTGVALTK